MGAKRPKPRKRRVRLSQLVVEVAWLVVIQRRLTQEVVEVGEQATDPQERLTQEVVEVAVRATGASRALRVTQFVVEVPLTFPVHPFGEDSRPFEEPWSPAFIQPPAESEQNIYGGLLPHPHTFVLGAPKPGVGFKRL